MRTARFLATGIFVTGVALIGGLGSASAAGAGGKVNPLATSGVRPYSLSGLPAAAYDIEAYNDYCTGGGFSCIPSTSSALDCYNAAVPCPGYSYADAEFYGPDTGATFGTPYEAYLECDNDLPSGQAAAILDVVSPAGYAAYGFGVYGAADMGVIAGNATLLGWAQFNPTSDPAYPEGNPAQTSSASVSVYDPVQGLRGTVTGVQNTDNTVDLPNSGGFRITLSGTITFTSYSGVRSTYQGTISCMAGGPHATDVILGTGSGSSGPYAEGELEYELGSDDL